MRPWIAAAMALAAVGLGYVHPFRDPRVEPQKGLGTLLRSANIPAAAKTVLITKCADCHSSETRWPLYARIAPGSWLIERDVVEGRKHMNLSRWEAISSDQQRVLMAKISQEAKSGDMPPLQYRALHWGTNLSASDIRALSLLGKSAGEGESMLAGDGDAVRGKTVFEKRCTGCHAMDVDREGPRLAGVYGRKAGSIGGFTYSAGLKHSGVTWNDAMLEKWLSDPDLMVPDNNMSFSVPKAEDRRDLIAYLKQ
jgi:cytochrome c